MGLLVCVDGFNSIHRDTFNIIHGDTFVSIHMDGFVSMHGWVDRTVVRRGSSIVVTLVSKCQPTSTQIEGLLI